MAAPSEAAADASAAGEGEAAAGAGSAGMRRGLASAGSSWNPGFRLAEADHTLRRGLALVRRRLALGLGGWDKDLIVRGGRELLLLLLGDGVLVLSMECASRRSVPQSMKGKAAK